jgi:mannose-6-phosphate isomerase
MPVAAFDPPERLVLSHTNMSSLPQLYPLRFQPLFRRYLWGGRKLGDAIGKPIGPEGDYAESWEIVDRGADQSVVAYGPLEGQTLHELVSQHGRALFGEAAPRFESFPLLFKFLDCQRVLSVQVHPDDAGGAKLDPPDLGKTEAWIILQAEPGSVVYAGIKRGFDRAALAREVNRGTTELCLHRFEPQVGDCLFIPAGTVHALGAGLLVAEVQQASDTTFRLFDWNRTDASGQPRPLHVEQALETIDFSRGPLAPQKPTATGRPHVERLVACDKFVIDRWRFRTREMVNADNRIHLLAMLEGEAAIEGDPAGRPLVRGDTMLVPACRHTHVQASSGVATMLDITLPESFCS